MSRKGFFKAALLALVLCTVTPVTVKTVQVQTVKAAAKKNGWVTKGKYKYYYKDGKKCTGTTKIGNYYYYFYSDGRMAKNRIIRNYYFISDGRRYTGKNKYARVGNKYYWFNSKSQASIKRGWANVGNYRMYLSTKGVPYTGTRKIGKYYYYFDSRGRMQGDKIINGYYFLKDGRRYTGRNRFVKVGNRYYWINSKRKAIIKKGWQTINGQRYYLSSTGAPYRSHRKIGRYYYYFDSQGRMQKNKVVSGYYYLKDGRRYVGKNNNRFINVNGTYYWLNSRNRASIKSGIQTIHGKKRLISTAGKILNGVQTYGGKVYYSKNHALVAGAGWVNVGSNRYYFKSGSYTASTGWQTISGKRYYFNSNGVMAKNTTKDGYTIDSNGVATKPAPKPSQPAGQEKPEEQPTPTPTPTQPPEKEPSAELKAALDEITSKSYTVYEAMAMNIISDGRFKFYTSGNPTDENAVFVTSSDENIAYLSTELDANGNPSILKAWHSGNFNQVGKSVTLTFKLGSYVKTCQLTVEEDPGIDMDSVSDEELATKWIQNQTENAQEVMRLINDYRAQNGVEPLQWEEIYCLRSSSAMAGYDILKGIRTNEPGDLADHGASQIGFGSTGYSSPQEAVNEWISSPMHKANILDPSFETIGVTFLYGEYNDGFHSTNGVTSVICTLSGDPEVIQSYPLEMEINQILSDLSSFISSKDELNKYLNWFYRPTGVSATTATEKSEEAVAEANLFGDGSTPAFTDSAETVSAVSSAPQAVMPETEETLVSEPEQAGITVPETEPLVAEPVTEEPAQAETEALVISEEPAAPVDTEQSQPETLETPQQSAEEVSEPTPETAEATEPAEVSAETDFTDAA